MSFVTLFSLVTRNFFVFVIAEYTGVRKLYVPGRASKYVRVSTKREQRGEGE